MKWLNPENSFQDSDSGCRVVAVRVADGWRYSAWSAPALPDLSFWQWYNQTDHPVSYPLGCHVPQRVRLIGVYPSASAARSAYETTTMGPSALNDVRDISNPSDRLATEMARC